MAALTQDGILANELLDLMVEAPVWWIARIRKDNAEFIEREHRKVLSINVQGNLAMYRHNLNIVAELWQLRHAVKAGDFDGHWNTAAAKAVKLATGAKAPRF